MIKEQAYHVEVEAIEPLRIGGAPDPLSGQDNPVALVGSQATIPGSSLKGALRAEIERFLIDLYFAPNARWPDAQRAAQPCLAATQLSPAERQLRDSNRYRQSCSYPLQGATGICPACYVLGAQGVVGFVKVPFVWCEVGPDSLYAARIDRSTGTVARGANRQYQLLSRGTRFVGTRFVLEEDTALGWRFGEPRPLPGNPDAWLSLGWTPERVLNEMVLDRLRAINYLGGYRSKGMGRVRITVRPLET